MLLENRVSRGLPVLLCTYVLTNSDAMFEKSHLLLIPVYIFTKLISETAQWVQKLLGVFIIFVKIYYLKSKLLKMTKKYLGPAVWCLYIILKNILFEDILEGPFRPLCVRMYSVISK